MIQTIIAYIIGLQICVGLFHAGIGIELWSNSGVYDSQTLYILALGIGTLLVQKRLHFIPIDKRSISLFFQHALFLGMLSWFFYQPWGYSWEVFFVWYMGVVLTIMILCITIESQFRIAFGSGNWGIHPALWRLGTLITLINTVTIPIVFIILHESLATIWVYYGLSWAFLWKESISDSIENSSQKI